jgi:hypothetical protein
MNHDFCRTVLATALLPLAMGGCAVQGGATADSAAPPASAPQVATAAAAATSAAEESTGTTPAVKYPIKPLAGDASTAEGDSAQIRAEAEAAEQESAEGAADKTHAAPQTGEPGAPGQAGQRMTQPAQPAAPEFEPALPARGEVLAFRIVECGVRYPWAKRTLLVGPRRYGRMASVKLWAAHVSEPGHRVRGTANSERVHFDTFPGWARPLMEGQAYPFPLEQPAGASLERWIEPVVVAGIASGLVYLFYQNQK